MKGPGGRALKFTFWPLEEMHWPWPSPCPPPLSTSTPPARFMTYRVDPGLLHMRTFVNLVVVAVHHLCMCVCKCLCMCTCTIKSRVKNKLLYVMEDGTLVLPGEKGSSRFLSWAQRVSTDTSPHNLVWQSLKGERPNSLDKIIGNGTRWLNEGEVEAALHTNGVSPLSIFPMMFWYFYMVR